jgi:protein-disulfide isomerase
MTEGNPKSGIRVIVYEDLECPDSAAYTAMLDERLLPRYGALVAFEHRDFPLPKHAWARRAAIAARYLDTVNPDAGLAFRRYTHQHLGEIERDNFDEVFTGFAAGYEVDSMSCRVALDDAELAALVDADHQEGIARGVSKTPTVFVNGKRFVESFTVGEISKAIDDRLAALDK